MAALFVSPKRLGTETLFPDVVEVDGSVVVGVGPLETTRVTVEPLLALAPAGGLVLMTFPASTVSEGCVFVVILKPAWPRMLPASEAS